MKYDIQYDICAIAVTLLVSLIYVTRSRFLSKTNKIFISIMACNFFAALFDVASCYTISYPESVPLWLNELFSVLYLWFYNHMSVFYFTYVWKKSLLKKFETPFRILTIGSSVFYTIILTTTPWTHFVFYFEGNEYCHGPAMTILYVMPFVMFLLEIMIFVIARNRFNKYQLLASLLLIVCMTISVGLSIIFPRVLTGCFVMAVIMFFVYVVYENPSYYTYLDTLCLNKNAFMEDFDKRKKNALLVVESPDYDFLEHSVDYDTLEQAKNRVADQMHSLFGKDVYNIADDRYAVMVDRDCDLTADRIITAINATVSNSRLKLKIFKMEGIKDLTVNDVALLIQYVNRDCRTGSETMELLSEIKEQVSSSSQILTAIRRAIKNKSFNVFYQPIYDVNTGAFSSCEALVRLIDPEYGFIDPETMIILAEKHGYINTISDILFELICKFYAENRLEKNGIHYIEVNLSPKQCVRENLVEDYTAIVEKYGLKPGNINLEVTETADFKHNDIVIRTFEEFKKRGFLVSLDDYGSGYASPNYLIQFPLDYVKIDREILWAAMTDPKARFIFENTLYLIRTLDKKIIVEGAESQAMVDYLEEQKVDFIQGYEFSKPLSEGDYLDFLNRKEK